MKGVTAPRLALIGVDAAELSFVRAHATALPTFAGALERGRLRRLESTAALLSGSVWPTFSTGTSPGAHGVYHHLQWDAERMRLKRITEDWLPYEPFWCELERRGLNVVALDVPLAFGPRLTRGVEVGPWGVHDQIRPFAAAPARLEREIRRRFGRHPMGPEIPVEKTSPQLERVRSDLVRGARVKGALARWLLESHEWDLFVAVFGECHRGGHLLWPEEPGPRAVVPERALLDVYRAVDDAIRDLLYVLERFEATVVLFSLHGMGPNTSQEHFVPRIMSEVNRRFAAEVERARVRPSRRGAVRLLRERLPAGLQNAVARAVPVAVRDEVVNRAVIGGHDWQRTPGFALLTDLNGYVRFNVRGRERLGALERDGCERYAEFLQACFRSFRVGGSDEPLVKDVVFSADAFSGERVDRLPDVVVTWPEAPPATAIVSETAAFEAEIATGRSGNHRPDGFCLVLERPGEEGSEPPEHIADLADWASRRLTSPS